MIIVLTETDKNTVSTLTLSLERPWGARRGGGQMDPP